MKIAMVCPYDFFKPGGVQTHIRELSNSLRARGHEVKVIAPPSSQNLSQHNLADPKLIVVGANKRIKFQGTQIDLNIALGKDYQVLKQILNTEEFDLIHYHTIWNPFIPFQVLWSSKRISKTVSVATFHDTPANSWFGKIASKLLMPGVGHILAKYCLDATIAVSSVPANILKRFYNGKIHIIPNGVEIRKFSSNNSQPFAEYLDGKINILFLGRLETRKGITYLLQAYAILKKRYKNLRLLIAGEGYLREEITEFVEKNNLVDVEMLGYVSEKDKPRYYATCDIYCSPAIYGESFGMVLVEAMASGKPAIGAANAGYKTILTDKAGHLLAEPRSCASLQQKLTALIENENLRQELGNWGKAAAANYDWALVTDKTERVYGDVLHYRTVVSGKNKFAL